MRQALVGKPLLFLDIDGVLNSLAFAKRVKAVGSIGIDPLAAVHLQRVVDETDCNIILSSTWRLLHSLAEMRGLLIAAGMRAPVPLVGRTPDLTTIEPRHSSILKASGRGFEINKWIEENQFTGPYVCIDDDRDFLPGQPLVQTTWQDGMQDIHATLCIDILSRSTVSAGGQ